MVEHTNQFPEIPEDIEVRNYRLDFDSLVAVGSVAVLEEFSSGEPGGLDIVAVKPSPRPDRRSPQRPFVPTAPVKPRGGEQSPPGRPSRQKAGRTKKNQKH